MTDKEIKPRLLCVSDQKLFHNITRLIRWIPFVYYHELYCNKNKSLLSDLRVGFCYELQFSSETDTIM